MAVNVPPKDAERLGIQVCAKQLSKKRTNLQTLMALTQKLLIRQSQALVMTPQLMQAIKLLQLSNLDLVAYVENELERNPLLERSDGEGAPDRDGPAEPEAAPERPAGETMEDFRQRGMHPLALACGKENDVEGGGHRRTERTTAMIRQAPRWTAGVRTGRGCAKSAGGRRRQGRGRPVSRGAGSSAD